MEKVRAKKNLGQHFLKDLSIARNIVASLPVDEPTDVLEIGPGMGVLTQYLLENPNINLKVVELDGESVSYLERNFPALSGRIIPADFLKLKLEDFFQGKFCIIGNYPYNISSQIFFKLLDYRDSVPVLTGMVQKEVAERIAAHEGSKTYGILSVLLQAYYDIEYLFTVDERVFDPPPKVKSAVIRLTRNEVENIGCNEALLKHIVKTSFNQRRKTLRNSLRSILKPETDTSDDIFGMRPEQLSVKSFIELTNRLESFVVK